MQLRVLYLLVVFMTSDVVYSKDLTRHGRDSSIELCQNSAVSAYTRNKIQCYCKETLISNTSLVFKADCTIDDANISDDDDVWRAFSKIKTVERLTLTSKSDKVLTYIPTLALKSLRYLLKLSIQHSFILDVHAYAFANLTNIEEIKLSGNGIVILSQNSFAHHPNLTIINLDNNNVEIIKRHVFRRMPHLQELRMNSNNISIIHDRAFSHLDSLRTLELDKNKMIVFTNETFYGLHNLTRLELSHNNVEIIGDSTFAALKNLRTLNLAYNKIKVLDDRAFNGLVKLESLSLDHNKIKKLSSTTIFTGLPMLYVLNVNSNDMELFTKDTAKPILGNLYTLGGGLGFEDNKYPCDCHLSWFLELKNTTKNTMLQAKIDNLLCHPSPLVADEFKKSEDIEKANVDDLSNDGNDYDYYDERSLGGRLFFSDIPPKILPCPTLTIESKMKRITNKASTARTTTIQTTIDHYKVNPFTTAHTKPSITNTKTSSIKLSSAQSDTSWEKKSSSVHTTTTTETTSSLRSTSISPSTSSSLTSTTTTIPTPFYEISELSVTTQLPVKTPLPELFGRPTTIKYKMPKLYPTEEMVSDGESSVGKTTSYIEEVTDRKVNAIISTHEPKDNDNKQRHLIYDTRVNNFAETKAESMSHLSSQSVRALSDLFSITLSLIMLLRIQTGMR